MPAAPNIYHSSRWGTDYRWFNGGWVSTRDYAILIRIQAIVMSWWGILYLTQGGLSTAVRASASTHNGVGAFDVSVRGHSKAQVMALCVVFLLCGLIPFPRGWISDSFQNNKHIHVVSWESDSSVHPSAFAQLWSRIYGYFYNGNGLGGIPWQRYAGPKTKALRWAKSPYNSAKGDDNLGGFTPDASPAAKPVAKPVPEGLIPMSNKPPIKFRRGDLDLPAGGYRTIPVQPPKKGQGENQGEVTILSGPAKFFVTATIEVSGLNEGASMSARFVQQDSKSGHAPVTKYAYPTGAKVGGISGGRSVVMNLVLGPDDMGAAGNGWRRCLRIQLTAPHAGIKVTSVFGRADKI